MVSDRNLTREQIEEWIHKHLATFPDRDEAWQREVLNIRASGLARIRRAKAVATGDEAA
jgi:hypothetical protein